MHNLTPTFPSANNVVGRDGLARQPASRGDTVVRSTKPTRFVNRLHQPQTRPIHHLLERQPGAIHQAHQLGHLPSRVNTMFEMSTVRDEIECLQETNNCHCLSERWTCAPNPSTTGTSIVSTSSTATLTSVSCNNYVRDEQHRRWTCAPAPSTTSETYPEVIATQTVTQTA
ncbi:hypothetical protein RSAG8_13885, partial [Rhizoctonia solani AG-8 WAC10335]